ncbi:hypothetical protein ACFWXK_28485, partial [Streptomyces sp. NPDC059070]|uniref:hypothetical protein n=1 Tax=Streptomyces sp. NPDC059070 TaxID=3346713 RepID=UPI0036736A09
RFLRFRLYQIVFRSDFLGAFQVFAFALPFPAAPTLSVLFLRSDHFVLRRTENQQHGTRKIRFKISK